MHEPRGTYDFVFGGGSKQTDVLHVPVVAHKESGPGVHKVGKQKIGVEILARFEASQRRVYQHRVVLQDDSKREFAVELPVPPGADNVVGEDAFPTLKTP